MDLFKDYIINVHYPKSNDEMLEFKKIVTIAYVKFVKEYVMNLPINEEERTKIYLKVIDKLTINVSK